MMNEERPDIKAGNLAGGTQKGKKVFAKKKTSYYSVRVKAARPNGGKFGGNYTDAKGDTTKPSYDGKKKFDKNNRFSKKGQTKKGGKDKPAQKRKTDPELMKSVSGSDTIGELGMLKINPKTGLRKGQGQIVANRFWRPCKPIYCYSPTPEGAKPPRHSYSLIFKAAADTNIIGVYLNEKKIKDSEDTKFVINFALYFVKSDEKKNLNIVRTYDMKPITVNNSEISGDITRLEGVVGDVIKITSDNPLVKKHADLFVLALRKAITPGKTYLYYKNCGKADKMLEEK